MKKHVAKREGLGLVFRVFEGKSDSYIVFRTTKGSYHVFAEVDAKAAARDCGAPDGNTRAQWKAVWDAFQQVKRHEPKVRSNPQSSGESALDRLRRRNAKA